MLLLSVLTIIQLGLYSGSIASPVVSASESRDESGVVKSPLDVFEVQAPLRTSYEGTACQQVVLEHTFAASYGTPYVGVSQTHRDTVIIN
jgi:hypothetical protein